MSAVTDKLILCGLAVILVFTTAAHGVVEPWHMAAFELLALALGLISGLQWATEREFRFVVPTPAWPMIGLLLLGLTQTVTVESGKERASLSLDAEATRSTVIALVALIIIFIVAANYLNTPTRLMRAAHFLTLYGFVIAVLAFVFHFADGKGVLTAGHPVRGPFVNRNHFAGHMEMILPMPIALVIGGVVPGRRLLFAFIAVVIGAVSVASLSRGGMVSIGVEMLFLAAMSFGLKLPRLERRRGEMSGVVSDRRLPPQSLIAESIGAPRQARISSAWAMLTVVAFAAGIVAAGLWIDHQTIINRVAEARPANWESGNFLGNRGWLWRDTLAMIARHPITGVGLGAYAAAYPAHAQADCRCAPEQAHNDYLQILADAGVVGGVLALTFLVLTLRDVGRAMQSSDPRLAAVALGCGTGIVGLLVHSALDFNLQLPSNSYLFLLLVAAGFSVARAAKRQNVGSAAQV